MKSKVSLNKSSSESLKQIETSNINTPDDSSTNAFTSLSKGVYAALETYSNVHRGSGHNSLVSTNLYEQARAIVEEFYSNMQNENTNDSPV